MRPIILKTGNKGSGVLQTPAGLPSQKESAVPAVQEDGLATQQVWKVWRKEKLRAPKGSFITIITGLRF
jgi:hypothetical protein